LQDGETQAFGSANGGMRIYSEEEKLKKIPQCQNSSNIYEKQQSTTLSEQFQ
jgi:hypothetical protein